VHEAELFCGEVIPSQTRDENGIQTVSISFQGYCLKVWTSYNGLFFQAWNVCTSAWVHLLLYHVHYHYGFHETLKNHNSKQFGRLIIGEPVSLY